MYRVWWTALMRVQFPQKVAEVAKTLYDMGCYEVSLGETIGTATPLRVRAVWKECLELLPKEALAGHFHDTYGMAITNIYESIQQGIRSFDSSISGLGGCPYAKVLQVMLQLKMSIIWLARWVLIRVYSSKN